MNLFDQLDQLTETEKIIKAAFGWPGGKSRSISNILGFIPYRTTYVSVFGGSGIDILNRKPSKLDVFNDRYAGVTDFYRCLKNPVLFSQLCHWLQLTVNSKEEFYLSRDTWVNCLNPVERAGRWYYSIQYSFGLLGRNWGRAKNGIPLSGKIQNALPLFQGIHDRFQKIQIDNLDWYDCLIQYDSPETVFYLDPPYIDGASGIYKHELTKDDHRRMIDVIFGLQGFVAVSGYSNPLYDNQNWNAVHHWNNFVSMASLNNQGNGKENINQERIFVEEKLWIKE
jgi:DNA adenine methylase